MTGVLMSDMHAYDEEHRVQVGGDVANFSARACFRKSDGRETQRVMPRAGLLFDRQRKMRFVHTQYIGFFLRAYTRATGDGSMSRARRLANETSFSFHRARRAAGGHHRGEPRRIIIQRTSRRYVTTVRGVLPLSPTVLQFARPVLKAAIATIVAGLDDRDLIMGLGSLGRAKAVVWEEDFRRLNWFRLIIILAGAFAVLTALHVAFRPLGMGEIASAYVADGDGARSDPAESPLFPDKGKRDFWFAPRRPQACPVRPRVPGAPRACRHPRRRRPEVRLDRRGLDDHVNLMLPDTPWLGRLPQLAALNILCNFVSFAAMTLLPCCEQALSSLRSRRSGGQDHGGKPLIYCRCTFLDLP